MHQTLFLMLLISRQTTVKYDRPREHLHHDGVVDEVVVRVLLIFDRVCEVHLFGSIHQHNVESVARTSLESTVRSPKRCHDDRAVRQRAINFSQMFEYYVVIPPESSAQLPPIVWEFQWGNASTGGSLEWWTFVVVAMRARNWSRDACKACWGFRYTWYMGDISFSLNRTYDFHQWYNKKKK